MFGISPLELLFLGVISLSVAIAFRLRLVTVALMTCSLFAIVLTPSDLLSTLVLFAVLVSVLGLGIYLGAQRDAGEPANLDV